MALRINYIYSHVICKLDVLEQNRTNMSKWPSTDFKSNEAQKLSLLFMVLKEPNGRRATWYKVVMVAHGYLQHQSSYVCVANV